MATVNSAPDSVSTIAIITRFRSQWLLNVFVAFQWKSSKMDWSGAIVYARTDYPIPVSTL